ncbi:MAG TPA: CDP-diacylglycerol diphosphatase, partial [Burkholderiaceae bacterium]|nr:CDP-diacylglycerol diphosphatase [Burkholderiaceae bacterium]
PTARRTGVESPELQTAGEPNYFALAWEQRDKTANAAPGDADVGLAINSRYGRSQSQLHIHIDRLRPEVRAALRGLTLPIGTQTYLELMGHRYRVDHLDTLAQSPFARAAREWDARTLDERARLTLAIAGDGAGGFFLLSDRADLAALDRGHAEELLRPRSCN